MNFKELLRKWFSKEGVLTGKDAELFEQKMREVEKQSISKEEYPGAKGNTGETLDEPGYVDHFGKGDEK
jgi:hypothetical protein